MVEALVYAVGNGAVVEQGGKDFLDGMDHVVHATDVEEGFLLTSKGGIRQVFGSGGGAHGHSDVRIAGRQHGKVAADIVFQLRRQLAIHHPLTDLRAGLGQSVDIINVEGIKQVVDALVQTTLFEEVTIGISSGGKTTGNGNTGASQVADHLAERGILATDTLHIVEAEVIEGNYILCQGDFSPRYQGTACAPHPACGRVAANE